MKEERMRGQTIGRLALLCIASAVVVAALAVSARSQAPLDAQSLIGDWNGSWTNKKAQGVNGQYQLKIEQVNGNKVYGQVVISWRDTVRYKLVGTLDGNRLTFGTENPTELLIEGNQIKGSPLLSGPKTRPRSSKRLSGGVLVVSMTSRTEH
jgi:Tfp pilus assembly protein FimT